MNTIAFNTAPSAAVKARRDAAAKAKNVTLKMYHQARFKAGLHSPITLRAGGDFMRAKAELLTSWFDVDAASVSAKVAERYETAATASQALENASSVLKSAREQLSLAHQAHQIAWGNLHTLISDASAAYCVKENLVCNGAPPATLVAASDRLRTIEEQLKRAEQIEFQARVACRKAAVAAHNEEKACLLKLADLEQALVALYSDSVKLSELCGNAHEVRKFLRAVQCHLGRLEYCTSLKHIHGM